MHRGLKVNGSNNKLSFNGSKLTIVNQDTISDGTIKLALNIPTQSDLTFKLRENFNFDFLLKWGDGSYQQITQTPTSTTDIIHTYQAGTYTLTVSGLCEALYFYNQDLIIEIIDWGNYTETNLKDISFFNCSNLTTIPEDSTGLSSINNDGLRYGFSYCNILSIPSNFFAPLSHITRIDYLFNKNNNISTLPVGLFDNLTNLDSATLCFAETNITTIPDDFLSNNINITYIPQMFSNCYQLTTIPNDLFNNLTNLISVAMVFNNCSNLTGCAEELWNQTKYPDIQYHDDAFNNCTSLSNYSSDGGCSSGQIPNNWI
jgi:hypothetical protein